MESTLASAGIKKELIENALHWRYATKVFDKTKIITDDKVELLLETLRLAPSSIDIQPWKFILIKNKTIRKELVELSMAQNQLTDASHLLLLCSLEKVDARYLDRMIKKEKEENAGLSTIEQYRELAVNYINSKTKEELREWLGQQVYIAMGFLLMTCAMLHMDACPIEAFDHSRVDKLLDLHQKGIESRAAVAIGYRSEKDQHARDKKLRWPKEEILITI